MNKFSFFIILFSSVCGSLRAQTSTFPSTGNVGIGTTSPVARLSFNDVSDGSNGADGITWYNPTPLLYGYFVLQGLGLLPIINN